MAKDVKNLPRLKALYNSELQAKLTKDLGLSSVMAAPKLTKIVVSSGVGKKKEDKHYLELVKNTLEKITGQAATGRLAKKSIATFKIRKGQGGEIGYLVTLRNDRMYEFLDRLISVALPHTRDFHGVPAKFDKQGNYNLGIREQSIFTELSFEETATLHGLEISFVIKNGRNGAGQALLTAFGMPFERKKEK
jgi:large subunit ribosomal protein L5